MMLRSLLLATLLLPTPAFAATNPWEKIEAQSTAHGPVIINYQITPEGARVFGEVPNASGEVELSDNGSVLARVTTLSNYTFEAKLEKPLDPSIDHRISVKGFDLDGNPVKLEGPGTTSPTRTETSIVFTAERLEAQRVGLAELQNPTVTGNPTGDAALRSPDTGANGPATAPARTSRAMLLAIVFVVVLVVAGAGYAIWRRLRAR